MNLNKKIFNLNFSEKMSDKNESLEKIFVK